MSFAEFQIRLFSFKRQELARYQILREVMWTTYISSHLDPKKMAKKKEAFFPLPSDGKLAKRVSDEQRENFIKIYKQWQMSN
jgi:hypothetical protein